MTKTTKPGASAVKPAKPAMEVFEKVALKPIKEADLIGQRRMIATEAAGIAQVINEPVAEVLRRAGILAHSVKQDGVPVVGWVDAKGVIHSEGVQGPRVVEGVANPPADMVAVRNQGERTWMAGSTSTGQAKG